jgi:hypothetical protein
MRKLSLILSCFAISSLQLNQASFSLDPTVGASSKTATDSISSITKGNLFQTQSTAIPDSNNFIPKPNTDSNLVSYASSGTLAGLSNLFNSKTNRDYTVVSTRGSNINLERGNVLICPEQDVVVNTPEGVISVGAKAVVFIMKSESGIVIYDLFQAKPKQVTVSLSKQKLIMGPGVMLVLTSQTTTNFENLAMNCRAIKYRSVRAISLDENCINAFAANFSIFSALVKIEPLRVLVDSKNKQEQSLLAMLLKTAVMLRY